MAEKRPKMPRPAAVADLLAEIFQGKPAGKRLKEGKIWLVWEIAVGEQIAAHARPAGFREGVLTVAVASAPWMQQLSYLKKNIIAKLNKRLGEELVKDIFLRAGSREPSVPQPTALRKKARPLSSEEKERIAERAAAIADPELRGAFASLMARHKADSEE